MHPTTTQVPTVQHEMHDALATPICEACPESASLSMSLFDMQRQQSNSRNLETQQVNDSQPDACLYHPPHLIMHAGSLSADLAEASRGHACAPPLAHGPLAADLPAPGPVCSSAQARRSSRKQEYYISVLSLPRYDLRYDLTLLCLCSRCPPQANSHSDNDSGSIRGAATFCTISRSRPSHPRPTPFCGHRQDAHHE